MMCAPGWLLRSLLLLLLLLCSGTRSLLHRRSRSVPPCSQKHPTEEWFQQKLDHFSNDKTLWSQRYLKNDEFFTPGGPVFLMIEGEIAANPDLLKPNMTWVNFARRLGALCLLLEHRFYGFSRPTDNLNITNLQYLNSRQALEDVANFRREIVKKLGLNNNKWILVGGSYAGSLAAWLRIKYPDLFVAALASSAPLKAKVDFYEFLEVVQTSLAAYNIDCPKAVKNASDTLQEILSYPVLHIKVAIDFNLCKLPQVDSEAEKAFFLESLALPFMEAVQFNNRFMLSQGNVVKRTSISDVCNIMTNESLGWPYKRYAAVSNMVLKKDGAPCLSSSYKSYVRLLSRTSWKNILFSSGRQWTYQACNEFGLFQSTTSNNQPFSGMSLSGLLEQCSDIFGPEFNSTTLAAAVEATNKAYGGLNVTGSKIIFTNGSLDPWHVLGITKTINEDLPAIFIEGESHCADIYLGTPQDSPQLMQAREKIFKILEKWLTEATVSRN